MLKKITTTAAFLSAAITAIPAANAISFTDPVDGKFDMGDYLAENAYGFLPVPIIITEPAVGYGGGAMGIFLHESDSEKQQRKQLAQQSLDGGAQLIPPAVTVVGAAVPKTVPGWLSLLIAGRGIKTKSDIWVL